MTLYKQFGKPNSVSLYTLFVFKIFGVNFPYAEF